MKILGATLVLLLPVALGAQRVLWHVDGTRVNGQLGLHLRDAGDIDGDGIHDLLATDPGAPGNQVNPPARVHLLSGRTGAVLHTFDTPQADIGFGHDATGIADCNGDQVRDIAIAAWLSGQVFVYSGASGALIRSVGSFTLGYGALVCDAGDFDGDGRGDVLTSARQGSNSYALTVLGGASGTVLAAAFGSLTNWNETYGQPFVDLDQDVHDEMLISDGSSMVAVVSLFPTALMRVIPRPAAASSFSYGGVGFADVDGNGTPELLVADISAQVNGTTGTVFVIDPVAGTFLGTLPLPQNLGSYHPRAVLGLGDLDLDGRQDFIIPSLRDGTLSTIELAFGRDLHRIDYLPQPDRTRLDSISQSAITTLGDVDGDGFADFAIGLHNVNLARGAVEVISGRILAQVQSVGSGCGGGPFLPQLGLTRPILGQTAQIVGRDLPATAPGLLAFSLRPADVTHLGVIGCDIAFDFGSWITLALLPPSPSLSMPLPIPTLPQLAGIEIALQTIHFGTSGALGVDLSNGVWARIGY